MPSAENNKVSGDNAASASVSSYSFETTFKNTGCITSPTGSSSSSSIVDHSRGRILSDDKSNGSNDIGVGNSDPGGGTFRSRVVDAKARVRRYAMSLPVRARRLRSPALRTLSPSASSDGGQSSDDQGVSSGAEDAGSLAYGYDGVCSSGPPSNFPGKDGRRRRVSSPPPPLLHHRREHFAARSSIADEKAGMASRIYRPERQRALSGEKLSGERAQDGGIGRILSRGSLSDVSVGASGFDNEYFLQEDALKKTTLAAIAEQGQSFNGNTTENGGDTSTPNCENSDGRSRQDLEEEIASLKKELKKAELKQATTEATVASLLQRARAAELARDVKEIQVGTVGCSPTLSEITIRHHHQTFHKRSCTFEETIYFSPEFKFSTFYGTRITRIWLYRRFFTIVLLPMEYLRGVALLL